MAREFTGELDRQPTGGTAREFTGELDPAPAAGRVREFTGELDAASPAPAMPRRGGTRSEAKPFVADPEAAAAARARTDFAAADPRRTDAPPPEDRREFSLGQVGKDFRGGVEQVKALATGAGAFGGAVDWKAATEALADLDEIEAGRPPRMPMVPSPTGGAPRQGEPTALAKAMQAADPEGRKSIRASLTQALQRDEQFIARSVEAIKAYGEEQRKLSGKLPDFTDVRTAKGFAEWAVRNGAATAPTMAASMLAAAAGIINPAAGMASLGAVSGGMALGDMTAARAGHAAKVFEPDRFTNPDRIAEAEARQDPDTARHLADNVGATAALAVPYAALDFLGPAGTLARTGAKGLAKGGAGAMAVQGAKEMGKEAINEGGQEVVNIASDMLAGERRAEVTGEDVKRVANAAAVGGLMGAGGHAANVGTDAARGAIDKQRRTKAAEAGDVEEALKLAIEASPYGRAKARGFVADPPLLTDPPTKQRGKTEAVFREVAASYGMSPRAADAAVKAGEGKPLDALGGFYARAVQALQGRGLVGKPVDPEVLEALASGPVDPRSAPAAPEVIEPEQPTEAAQAVENIGRILGAGPLASAAPATIQASAPVEATQAPAAAAETTAVAANAGPTEDFTGLADPSAPPVMTTAVDAAAHQAAHSPTNDRPEPTPAQKEAGNYAKGHTRIGSLSIAIENPQGSIRRGTGPDGKAWESSMAAHYGYIKGTHAGDGDNSDVFIRAGTPPEYSGSVFVIDQVDPATGKFDEHKSVIGVNTADEARALYEANYQPGWKGFGAVTELPMEAFKSWVRDGVKRKPLGSLAAPDQSAPQGVGAEPAPSSQTSSTTNQGGENDLTNNGVRGEAAIGAASPAKPRKAPRGGSGPLDAISRAGGISPDIIADLSRKTARTRTNKTGKQTQYTAWHNPMAGGKGPVFRAGGTADLNELARILQENGFLEPGLVERDYLEANSRVQDILKAALNGEKVLREGDADAVEREMRARQEAAMDAQPDPFDFLSADDLASEGYTAATPRVRDLTERLLEDADAAGLDTEAMREDAARQTEGLTEDEYHTALQQAIDQALAQHGEGTQAGDPARAGAGASDRVQATGPPGPAGSERADRSDGALRPDEEGLTLQAQTAADLAAKTEREAAAAEADRQRQKQLEDRARADAMRDEFTLTGSDRPADVAAAAGQRDIFDGPQATPGPAARTLSDEQAFAGDFQRFAGKPVTQDVLVASTGQTAKLTIPDAAQALRDLAQRRRSLEALRACLGRRA